MFCVFSFSVHKLKCDILHYPECVFTPNPLAPSVSLFIKFASHKITGTTPISSQCRERSAPFSVCTFVSSLTLSRNEHIRRNIRTGNKSMSRTFRHECTNKINVYGRTRFSVCTWCAPAHTRTQVDWTRRIIEINSI